MLMIFFSSKYLKKDERDEIFLRIVLYMGEALYNAEDKKLTVMSVKVEADINIGREVNKLGKKISRRKKQRKFSVMELIDGCTGVHVDNAENENSLEHRKIRIMIQSSQIRQNF